MLAAWQLLFWYAGANALTSPLDTIALRAASSSRRRRSIRISSRPRKPLRSRSASRSRCGILIGFTLGLYRFAGDVAEPVLVALYSIPKITLYPIVLLAFGIGMPAKIAFGAIHGIVPIAIFALGAVRNLNPVYLKAARVMRLPPARIAARVLLPGRDPGNLHRHPHRLLAHPDRHAAGRDVRLAARARPSADPGDRAAQYQLIMALTLLLVVIAVTASALLLAVDRRLRRYASNLVHPLDIVFHALAQCRRVDLMHTARTGQIERMRGRRAHRDARAHDAHAGQCRDIAVDAAPGRDHVVALVRHEAAHRHIVQMVVAKRLPHMALRRVVQLDRPAGARDRVGKFASRAHVLDGELLAPGDPARLADAERAVGCGCAPCRTPPDIRRAGMRPRGPPAPFPRATCS